MPRLVEDYRYAYADFHGSGTPCVFKTGSPWPINEGIDSQKILRAARPIHDHPIQSQWLEIAWSIVARLDQLLVRWTTIDPLAYANAGSAYLICGFVITIGVFPGSLNYDHAVVAANTVVELLCEVGFPEIQVAFVESVYRRHGSGAKIMELRPLYEPEDICALRKPFTMALSVAIAPRSCPTYEGSSGLFFRLSGRDDDKRVAMLTCAHVTRPPPLYENNVYTRIHDSQPREDVIFLGTEAFDNALIAITKYIDIQMFSINSWSHELDKIKEPREDEHRNVALRRRQLSFLIESRKIWIEDAKELHNFVTKNYSTIESRVIGFVLHADKIEIGSDNFTCDWSFVQLDEDKIDWGTFKGNKIFVGGTRSHLDWIQLMFPQPHDRQEFHKPEDDLLQVEGFVPESEFRQPQNFDVNNVKCLLAVKNGRSSGTTFGRVNGLESVTRHYTDQAADIHTDALEYVVLGYDTAALKATAFSEPGDSGAIVAGRDGRIIGQITGGAGPTYKNDKTYVTPYYALRRHIERQFPGSLLYPIVE